MVKEADALLDKGNAELLSCVHNGVVVLGASWCSNVLDTRAVGTEHVVDEWELFVFVSLLQLSRPD